MTVAFLQTLLLLVSISKHGIFATVESGKASKFTSVDCDALFDKVNVFIGTGGPGFGYGGLNPGAQLPHSALRLGPDTTTLIPGLSFRHFSGYNYNDSTIRGFSHTHSVGAGAPDWGTIGIMPYQKIGRVNPLNGNELASMLTYHSNLDGVTSSTTAEVPDGPRIKPFWWSNFNKEDEEGSPGRYSVLLSESGVQADMLAIGRFAGVHRYSWLKLPQQQLLQGQNQEEQEQHVQHERGTVDSGLIIDVCHAAKLAEGVTSENPCREAFLDLADMSTTDTTAFLNSNTLQAFSARVLFDGSLTHGVWVYLYGEIVPQQPQDLIVSNWETCAGGSETVAAATSAAATVGGQLNISCSQMSSGASASSETGVLFSKVSFSSLAATSAMESAAAGEEHVPVVEVRVGISFVSSELAKQNLQDALAMEEGTASGTEAEAGDLTFEALAERTSSIWCEKLDIFSAVPLQSSSDPAAAADLERVLYTAHYHTHFSPTIYSESGGFYLGMDKLVHNVLDERAELYDSSSAPAAYDLQFFSDLSLWDTFRTQHPWLLLQDEPLAVGILRSMGEITVQQGAFPRWPMASTESGCMIGESGAAAVLEGILTGFAKEFDVEAIQTALLKQSTEQVALNGRSDVEHYMTSGYVSQEDSDDSSAKTLTYAFDDYLLSGISAYVGDQTAADEALQRSQNFRNIWSPERQFFCPKYTNGTMYCPPDPAGLLAYRYYREGDALHWMWFVPQDPAGLVSLFPSVQDFDDALEAFFVNHVDFHTELGSAVPNSYYWAGNEHDFLAPWLFNYGSDCTRTQYWVRRVVPMHFSNTGHGLPGNDDYGSMSSWVLFASLGLFPLAGTTTYLVGSPSVQEATITLTHFPTASVADAVDDDDSIISQLRIVSYNADDVGGNGSASASASGVPPSAEESIYVQRLVVNGVEHSSPLIDRSLLAQPGGVLLEFYLSATPVSGLCSSATSSSSQA